MARYRDDSYDQAQLMPISFRDQVLPGAFEYAPNYLIDHELDLAACDRRHCNHAAEEFQGSKSACGRCEFHNRCLKYSDRTASRQAV